MKVGSDGKPVLTVEDLAFVGKHRSAWKQENKKVRK